MEKWNRNRNEWRKWRLYNELTVMVSAITLDQESVFQFGPYRLLPNLPLTPPLIVLGTDSGSKKTQTMLQDRNLFRSQMKTIGVGGSLTDLCLDILKGMDGRGLLVLPSWNVWIGGRSLDCPTASSNRNPQTRGQTENITFPRITCSVSLVQMMFLRSTQPSKYEIRN